MAKKNSDEVSKLIARFKPDMIVVEETNLGKQRYSQKQLEFIHAMFIWNANIDSIKYISSSEWRKVLGISLNGDDKSLNKTLKSERETQKEELEEEFHLSNRRMISESYMGISKKSEMNKLQKKWDKECSEYVKKKMRSFRSKLGAKVTIKTVSVRYVNENLGLSFRMKDNDMADAICVGLAYIKNHTKK